MKFPNKTNSLQWHYSLVSFFLEPFSFFLEPFSFFFFPDLALDEVDPRLGLLSSLANDPLDDAAEVEAMELEPEANAGRGL